jgi:hypothetical protein
LAIDHLALYLDFLSLPKARRRSTKERTCGELASHIIEATTCFCAFFHRRSIFRRNVRWELAQKVIIRLGVVTHTYKISTWEAETGLQRTKKQKKKGGRGRKRERERLKRSTNIY